MLGKVRSLLAGRPATPSSTPPAAPVDEATYPSWEKALQASDGYGKEVILARALEAALAVKRGEAAFERDTVLFREPAYRWPLLACLASVAASRAGRLHVLDVGGSVASVYLQHRPFLRLIPGLRWSVVEQAHIAAAGRARLEEERLRFFETVGEAAASHPVDLFVLSGSLQYMQDPHATLGEVAGTAATHAVIDRVPFTAADADSIVIQHVPSEIYPASYPRWRLSEAGVVARMADLGFHEVARYDDGIDGPDHLGRFCERR